MAQYAGQFVSWNGGCLFIGSAGGVVPLHSHYAMQIGFGAEPGIGFRVTERDEWTRYGGAMIPSRQPHSMDATTVSANGVIFVEPETREGRVLQERYLGGGIAGMPADAVAQTTRLFDAWRAGNQDALVAESVALIGSLTGGVEPVSPSDERVLRAIAYINAHLDGKLTLEEVAEAAILSPSRFRHLFVEETGMALRPYILWRRFLRVWELASDGVSFSAAAHQAGFADAAHLSRTSKRMFGFAPTAMRVRTTAPVPQPHP
jgi:AraC-like DNA-binding protein